MILIFIVQLEMHITYSKTGEWTSRNHEKWNITGGKLISTSTVKVDNKNKSVFKSLSNLGREIVINTVDICSLIQVRYIHQKLLTH